MSTGLGAVWVPIGLLLVVLEVPAFGIDFAHDTVGLTLVAVASRRIGGDRWPPVTATAAAAAVVSLFGYGGPVSHLVVLGDGTWNVILAVEKVAGSSAFAAVLWALSATPAASRRTRALLGAAAGALLGAALTWAALVVATDGAPGAVVDLFGVMIGLLHGLTVVAAFLLRRKP